MTVNLKVSWFSYHWLLLVGALLLASCAQSAQNIQETAVAPQNTDVYIAPFIALAENANCAEDRNQLYLIDGQYFFHTTVGWCSDAGYAHTLYGTTIQEKLCRLEDSFVGPLSKCDPEFEEIFNIMVQNLDQPDLGLGDGHSVELVFEKEHK